MTKKQLAALWAALGLLAGFGGGLAMRSAAAPAAPPHTPAEANARYMLWGNPNIREDTFLLDTQTGMTFQLATDKQGNVSWQYTPTVYPTAK